MSQFDNIETYEKLIGTDYKPPLERFSRVLLRLGVAADEVQRAFDGFEWDMTDDLFDTGIVYAWGWEIADFKLEGSEITISPFVMGYTPTIDAAVADNWFHCGFRIDTDQLIPQYIWGGHVPWHYPAEAQQLITTLARAMHQEFEQATIYFTDISQETDLTDAVMKNDTGKRWRFNYALFPLEPLNLYMPIPASHAGRFSGGCFEAWNRNTWPQFTS
ncbi:hypothetical protein LGH70_08430 [Hymenobacter sp. BT635]|uniref:DUF2612 domain-containing protein n=1 Tax=Hymenobacter nitidus TaxID=2880929 RepID=A0ABS8AB23_9BACT|nr:hypothetical protein [Hymenobacter nitidus]MCB2377606.1 hypothetical protein [Hymenobacter nitidus]